MPTYLSNKKAYHDYDVLETYSAGIKLLGHEVKAIREGKGNLTGSYVRVIRDEVWLVMFHLPLYSKAGIILGYDPNRLRKLLLSEREISEIRVKVEQKGGALIPLKIYTERNLIKIDIALARGKKVGDKRADLIKAQDLRDTERYIKETTI